MDKLWFKAKRYGWGWVPCAWEGWLVLVIFIALIIVTLELIPDSMKQIGLLFVYTVILLLVCYKKGETPRWRWGE